MPVLEPMKKCLIGQLILRGDIELTVMIYCGKILTRGRYEECIPLEEQRLHNERMGFDQLVFIEEVRRCVLKGTRLANRQSHHLDDLQTDAFGCFTPNSPLTNPKKGSLKF